MMRTYWIPSRLALQVLFLAICCGALNVWSLASAADPLYQERAFDLIMLDEKNGNTILKVQPLKIAGRAMPAAGDRAGDLEFELLDRPGERFAAAWSSIVNIRFFEQLVLADAEKLTKDGRSDEALAAYRFLEVKFPKLAGLKDSVESYLWSQIGLAYKAGRQDEALALLVELHGRNPQRKGLSVAYERVTIELVKNRIAAGNYRAARRMLRGLTERFPDTAAAGAQYQSDLKNQAAKLQGEAKAALAAGKLREAQQASKQMLAIWPALEGGRPLAAEIHAQYPLVTVGVMSPCAAVLSPLSPAVHDWAARRTARLLGRPLLEPRLNENGDLVYRSAFGETSLDKDNQHLTLKMRGGLLWPGSKRPLTAHDVARQLLALADPARSFYEPAWPDLLAGLKTGESQELEMEFRHPQLQPEAWLQTALWPESAALPCGPYKLAERTAEQANFVPQAGYFAAEVTQPREIIERTFTDSAAAVLALRRGEISILDRISPWDLRRLATNEEVVVSPYALPTVHLLALNPRRPLLANRAMRRAILLGIDRQGILRRGLLAGQAIPGCDAISGPFPRGRSLDDRHGYAYDAQIEVRPYDPAVAMTLAGLAIQEERLAAQQPGDAALESPPKLVLAHPAEAAARLACESIARQLQLLGLNVSLRELPPGQLPGPDYDLLYVELEMQEPLVDVWRLLGPGGLTGDCSPSMLLALRALEASRTRKQAEEKLHAIHQLVAQELPVIPLWQIVDHFAHHKTIQGIGVAPIHLYEEIEHWQVGLRIPLE